MKQLELIILLPGNFIPITINEEDKFKLNDRLLGLKKEAHLNPMVYHGTIIMLYMESMCWDGILDLFRKIFTRNNWN